VAAVRFGPRALRAQLARLLPQYPHVELCVAFSGGLDSTVLLAALARGSRARPALRALHVNHNLHAAAGAMSAHCGKIARALSVPFKALSVRVPRAKGASLEAQARDARYTAFARELRDGEVLLTAHQADDQLETVLLQLLRGAGIAGLAAMPALARLAAGWHARPLLGCTRAELAAWAAKESLAWIEDPMNADAQLDRNYLRREVLPELRSRWPACARSVARSARHASQAQRLLSDLGRADAARCADGAALSVPALRALSPERRVNALRVWIDAQGEALPDARRLGELAGPLLAARADASPAVAWGEVVARRHADRLWLEPRAPAPSRAALSWSWQAAPNLTLPGGLGALVVVRDPHGPIDLVRLPRKLTVRWRAGGERLRPRADGPRRTLKTLLQEARVPGSERALLPLIFARMQLIAVADRWSDVRIQAQQDSKRRARIVWRRA
jgi:tRNA(Ile)-lysidine synthase